jgi:hypothetical protein
VDRFPFCKKKPSLIVERMSTNKKTLIDGDFQVGSSHLIVDTENNYVGFNNATPQNKIDVQIGTRTGTHSTGKPLYVTGVTSTSGAEFVSDDGTAGIGIGSSNIFATETNQNITITPDGTGAVGIKTDTPNPSGETFDLWVQGDTKITGNVTVNEIFGDGSGLFNVAGTQWVSSSEDIYFLNNTGSGEGKVGIGKTVPEYKLDILDSDKPTIRVKSTSTGDGDALLILDSSATGESDIDFNHDGVLNWRIRTGDASASGTTFQLNNANDSDVLTIQQNGNVGIGTNSPNVPLEVNKSAGGEMFRLATSTGTIYAGVDANPPWFGTSSDDHLRLVTNGTEKMRIESGGNVGIGTTDPDAKLHVNGGDFKISAAGGGGLYDNNYQWLECDNDASWYRLARTAKTNGIACYNGIAINQEGGLVVGSWDSPNALGVGNGKFTGTVTASTFSATSQLYLGTSASIRQSSSAWTGDPGSGVGKIEYHSNRWYVVAGSNSTELLRVRRNESDKFVIDNNGSITLGIVPAARISGTVASATNADTVDGQHAHEMSWGHDIPHGTYSDFNSFINTDKFGAHYVTGTTNGPGQSGPTQYYHQRLSLGSQYNQYSLQLAIGRNRSDNYLWYRNEENGSVGGWNKMRAGYADTCGTATNQSGGTVSCTSGSFSGTLTARTINCVQPDDNGVAQISAYGSSQGTGRLYVGQSGSYGGGIEYNGDNSPASTGAGADYITLFRVSNGTYNWTARNLYNNNDWEFRGEVFANAGWFRTYGDRGWYNQTHGGGWYMTDSTWIQSYNSKGLYVNNQIRMASLRALGGDYPSRLDWPNSGHHVDCYYNSSGHAFHINHYAQQPVYLNRTAYSDRRIKEDIKDIDDVSALNVLRKIKPKTYKYKLQPHKGTVYGFIAQDVREVLPYATNLTKLSAPFDREKFVNATILENGVVNLDKPCNELEIGKNAYFYYESSTSTRDFEVTEITSPTQFRVRIDEGGSEWIGNTILVGKEVDDFHGIDKDAIFTVATAALQEVDRQLQAEKARNDDLEARILALENA